TEGAISDYNRAIEINPNYTFAYYNRGITRSRQGDKKGAIADFDRAIELEPNYAPVYLSRGNARDDSG
ncbi:MAG TPA: hypothetical protein DDW56_24175, partial [Cyanobacteria bacterium UBA11366]|nr:hypothetical protein [Cyanobacteria bacterium UBA11366]